jgi:endonuclease YncB( thermonuclease family)
MVRRGFAYAKSYPPDIKYQKRLRAAESEARRKNWGLWLDK